jgi:hypothetical protein
VRVALQYGDYRIIEPIVTLKRGALGRVALQYGDYRIIELKVNIGSMIL